MNNYELYIGKNIREVRNQKGLSQENLAQMCDCSNTTLSSYENSRKIPNLVTIAKIARALNVTIERLYYGDDNNAFINAAPDEGKKVVNAVYYLWSAGVISYFENYAYGTLHEYKQAEEPRGVYLYLSKYSSQVKRLVNSLDEYKAKKDTYPDPDKYLEFLLSSVATEINKAIEHDKKRMKSYSAVNPLDMTNKTDE